MSRGKSSPIHLAECRDRLLDALREGASRAGAAESIGCNHKAFKRYLAANPEFEAKVEAAEAGLDTAPESASQAPAPIARVVIDAEPIDAAPVDVTGLAVYRDTMMESVGVILADPGHPHFARISDMMFKALYGPSLFRAMREAEREEDRGGERPRVLIIRVPAGPVQE